MAVCLANLPVIGEQTVDFFLHVGNLGQNTGAKPLSHRRQDFVSIKAFQVRLKIIQILAFAVAVGFCGAEKMVFHRVAVAAALAEHQRLLLRFQLFEGAEVDVQAFHICVCAPKPAGSGVDKPAAICLFQPFVGGVAAELPPSLVKNGPVADTGVIFQLIDRGIHALIKGFPGGKIFVAADIVLLLNTDGGQRRIPQKTVIAVVHHILENNHTQLVAGIIECLRLHFNMLAKGVKAQLFHFQDVLGKGGFAGRGVNAVRPVALIQHAVEEIGLAVQTQPGNAVYYFGFQRPQGKVRMDRILPTGQGEGVKLGVFRRPGFRIFRTENHLAIHNGKRLPFKRGGAV